MKFFFVYFFWDTLILHIYFLIIKIHNFRGDLSDISAKSATLLAAANGQEARKQDGIWGTDTASDLQLDQSKVQEALQKLRAEAAARAAREFEDEPSELKRKYNSLSAGEGSITNEDMEAYRINKERAQDPLASIRKKSAEDDAEYGLV